jgi:hypothetical protein
MKSIIILLIIKLNFCKQNLKSKCIRVNIKNKQYDKYRKNNNNNKSFHIYFF